MTPSPANGAPNTPRPSAGPGSRAPGTPRSSAGPASGAPGTLRSSAGPGNNAPGTPRSSAGARSARDRHGDAGTGSRSDAGTGPRSGAPAAGVVGVDRQLWGELLAVLAEALRENSRRPLARLADREGVTPDEALRDLAALPVRSCSAVDPSPNGTLRVASCTAGRGCPVEDECPLVRGAAAGRASIVTSGPAQLVGVLVRRWIRPLPDAPFATLAEFGPLVDRLLERSGRAGHDAAPRARTAHAVIDVSLHRGGPFGATGPYLTAAELEQVAAFVPPGSGRGDALLHPAEAWLRRAVSAEVALVDLRP